MTLRRTLGLVAAPLVLVVAAAGSASADGSASAGGGRAVGSDGARTSVAAPAGDNSGAWVSGVGQCDISSKADCWGYIDPNSGTPCPDGHFCIYSAPLAGPNVKIFSFYHCTDGGAEWALHNWDGTGYFHNSNSGGAHGYLKGVNHNVLQDVGPGGAGSFDFTPVWFVRAC